MYVSQKYYSVETGVHVSKYYLLISQVQYNSYQIQKKKKSLHTGQIKRAAGYLNNHLL